ncbi:MAG TPA: DUF2252 domain-containing protein [Candidatus Aquilonibacter sp.]|nr:DUF2252 domain-containing protein [Candidatus Aquilonibacter sp.]
MTTVATELTFAASPTELEDRGKALRESIERESHAQWKPHKDRENPIDILRKSDDVRLAELLPVRYGRMLPSPFAFFRGAASVMAADLAHTPRTDIRVQACGDCHLKNFGGFATPERNIIFDINDFDETLPAPWEWDIKRLAASFVLGVRNNGFSGSVARDAATITARSYREGMRAFAKLDPLELWHQRITAQTFVDELPRSLRDVVAARIDKAASRRGSDVDYPKLAEVVHGEVRIKETLPLIFHPEVTRQSDFKQQAEQILRAYRDTLTEERRLLFDRYRFVDAAIKVVGIGSVGTRCWIALMMSSDNSPLFLQLKQAGPSVLEPYAGKSQYGHNGQRVVVGQRLMQAASDMFLGWTSGPAGDFYVRQLRDAKISPIIENFNEEMFLAYAQACGRNLARAHAKSGNAWAIRGYLGKSDAFDDALAQFADAYADQTERDHAELRAQVRAGKIAVYVEE